MGVTCVFVSNYLNHHQIPFCDAMYEILRGSFRFVQTEPMEEERIRMGWNAQLSRPYLKYFYEEPEECKKMILEARVVIFGGTDDETYIEERLQSGRPVIRNSERLYKTGQWKAVSPRGLRKKYHDHTRYRKAPVYLLCSGAYVPSDFHIIRAYKNKMFCWGYFPEVIEYGDFSKLTEAKNHDGVPHLLWAGRMIDWKHPELAVETAAYLKGKGLSFHMEMIGGGELREEIRNLIVKMNLQDVVTLEDFQPPEKVREHMEKADIYLFTSDRQEGWGAVANESMNSGCALVADHMIGAVPYLIRHGENGLIYKDGHPEQLFALTEQLVRDRKLCRKLGENAFKTITEKWNAKQAAKNLAVLCVNLGLLLEEQVALEVPETCGEEQICQKDQRNRVGNGLIPCVPAPMISERKMYPWLMDRALK